MTIMEIERRLNSPIIELVDKYTSLNKLKRCGKMDSFKIGNAISDLVTQKVEKSYTTSNGVVVLLGRDLMFRNAKEATEYLHPLIDQLLVELDVCEFRYSIKKANDTLFIIYND